MMVDFGIPTILFMKSGQKKIFKRKRDSIFLKNWVPAIQLVSFDEAGHALGFLNLRLRLNDYLLEKGGHIGYSIRPSERGKGYAKEALHQGLQVAKEKNIHRALVTCSIKNPASRAVILANGGQLEDIRHETERYWIDLEQNHDMEYTKTTGMEV